MFLFLTSQCSSLTFCTDIQDLGDPQWPPHGRQDSGKPCLIFFFFFW